MCDYSGVIPLAWLSAWVLIGALRGRPRRIGDAVAFGAGAAIPILLQLHSQWASFGSWLHPPQTWMAPANFTDRGYQGLAFPAIDLFAEVAVRHLRLDWRSAPLFPGYAVRPEAFPGVLPAAPRS